MSQELQCTPPELVEIANSSIETLIPTKSRKLYDFAYEKFLKWCNEYNVQQYTENVMLAYFTNLSRKFKSSTLWAQYSMIKSQLNIKHNVKIEKYSKLIAFIKRQGENYTPKKSKVLTQDQFDKFLKDAPNNVYLATKVILIFGVTGALRCDELVNLKSSEIQDLGNLILVKIINTKNKKQRSFTIIGDFYLNLVRQYTALRPDDIGLQRFFIKYQNGKCHRVVMGIHKISNVPKDVATFLKLTNPHEYTGHCLRRTSATILVDNGGDITALKRHGGWKSTSVAEGYLEDSISSKTQTAQKILNWQEQPSNSSGIADIIIDNQLTNNMMYTNDKIVNVEAESGGSGLNLNNCSIQNCTFNITVNK